MKILLILVAVALFLTVWVITRLKRPSSSRLITFKAPPVPPKKGEVVQGKFRSEDEPEDTSFGGG